MKKKMLLISLVFIFFTIPPLYSQTAPSPPDPRSTGNTSGGGAPIGGGLFIMLGLGAAYAGKKIYQYKHQDPSD